MNVTFLTSSRADFGILRPLIRKMADDNSFDVGIIVFGTHLSGQFGMTVDEIEQENFYIIARVETFAPGDGPDGISRVMGMTYMKFADIWKDHPTELIICLGDRYEMFAAVGAAVPFNIPVAHISGGEVTEGAIDNVYRDALTLMATYHFASTDIYKENIIRIRGNAKNVYNVGALNLDNLKSLPLFSKEEFLEKYKIDLTIPTILITFHPETVSYKKNEIYISEIIAALKGAEGFQFVITMPNADTMGQLIREALANFIHMNPRAFGVESFGTRGYISCMKYCAFMLGNTSSGFVEASFFPKIVINLGDRQKGRILGKHIIDCPINKDAILSAINFAAHAEHIAEDQLYGIGNAAENISKILREIKN